MVNEDPKILLKVPYFEIIKIYLSSLKNEFNKIFNVNNTATIVFGLLSIYFSIYLVYGNKINIVFIGILILIVIFLLMTSIGSFKQNLNQRKLLNYPSQLCSKNYQEIVDRMKEINFDSIFCQAEIRGNDLIITKRFLGNEHSSIENVWGILGGNTYKEKKDLNFQQCETQCTENYPCFYNSDIVKITHENMQEITPVITDISHPKIGNGFITCASYAIPLKQFNKMSTPNICFRYILRNCMNNQKGDYVYFDFRMYNVKNVFYEITFDRKPQTIGVWFRTNVYEKLYADIHINERKTNDSTIYFINDQLPKNLNNKLIKITFSY